MLAGFFVGVVIGAPFWLIIAGLLQSGARDDIQQAAFQAGVEYERNQRRRVVARLRRQDLKGDPDSELGIRA